MTPPAATTPIPRPKSKYTLRFKIGIILLIAHTPVGHGGAALALANMAIGAATDSDKTQGTAIGTSIYILSWGTLGLGAFLAGPEGLKTIRRIWDRWLDRKRAQPLTPSVD